MNENNESIIVHETISKDNENHVGMNNIIKESLSTTGNKIINVSSSLEGSTTFITEGNKDYKDEVPTTSHSPVEIEQTSTINVITDVPISYTVTEQEIEKERQPLDNNINQIEDNVIHDNGNNAHVKEKEEGELKVNNDNDEVSPHGRYVKLDERLGSGAYKDVWRAYDTLEGMEVAWNVVKLGMLRIHVLVSFFTHLLVSLLFLMCIVHVSL